MPNLFLISEYLFAKEENVNLPGHKERCILEGGTGKERWLHCLIADVGMCQKGNRGEMLSEQKRGIHERNRTRSGYRTVWDAVVLY